MSTNAILAERFKRMAAILELLGDNPFKAVAYQRAARALEDLGRDIADLADDIERVRAIDGVGKGLADRIVEYVRTGRVEEIDRKLDEVPEGVLALLDIPGLGPKGVATLWRKGGVASLADLKDKIETGELEHLPRMGKKTLEKIARSIAFAEAGGKRIRIGKAMPVAEHFVQRMSEHPAVARAAYAGSLRRGQETIGDIDILAACDDPEKDGPAVGEAFRSADLVREVLAAGPTKSSVRIEGGMQVDLRVVPADRWGAALMYFTGSKQHNVTLRERAIKRKLRLNEYGLWRAGEEAAADAAPVAAATEQEVYEELGLAYIPPEMREDRGEIAAAEAARPGGLPPLVELPDIKAELHAHTTASDGHWSIEQLAEAARQRGFHTVAVTDHSVSSYLPNGLSPERLEKHIERVRAVNKKTRGITVLAGSEVDILADGRLDYADSLLAELDIVVASPHAALTQPPDKATRRLLCAIESPYVHILGHPTGRIIQRREGLSPDMHKVIEAAAATGTALEINANHHRLDLRDTHARAAVEAGVMLAVNTDAHGPPDLDELRYGILTARRAWARPEQIINCLSATKLKQWLKAKRRQLA